MSINPLEEIYVTLPSNVSRSVFKTNTPSNYKTKLRAPLDLPGEWEVALIDIQYPHKWNNFKKECNIYFLIQCEMGEPAMKEQKVTQSSSERGARGKIVGEPEQSMSLEISEEIHSPEEQVFLASVVTPSENTASTSIEGKEIPKGGGIPEQADRTYTMAEICTRLGKEIPETYGHVFCQFAVPAGYYNSFEDVGKYVSTQFIKLFPKTKNVTLDFQYDKIKKRARFVLKGGQGYLFSDDDYLMNHLGMDFGTKKKLLGRSFYEYMLYGFGESEPFLEDISTMYIYSDLIEYQLVGDTQVPLMGVFPIQGEHGKQLYWNFNPPYYIPVTRAHIPDIEIQLSTSTAKLVEITDGDVICRLHFRKKFLSRSI